MAMFYLIQEKVLRKFMLLVKTRYVTFRIGKKSCKKSCMFSTTALILAA